MQEIIAAEHLWYKEMQMKLDEKEKSSTVWEQLGVFKDADGVLRCKGRIQNCSLPYSAKFPVLLPRKQYFTQLVIRQSHENVKHNGVRETLTEVCSKFWIIKGRQAVKDVLFKCVISKKVLGKAFSTPPTPPPPTSGASDDLAFTEVGVDFTGPLYTLGPTHPQKRSRAARNVIRVKLKMAENVFVGLNPPSREFTDFYREMFTTVYLKRTILQL